VTIFEKEQKEWCKAHSEGYFGNDYLGTFQKHLVDKNHHDFLFDKMGLQSSEDRNFSGFFDFKSVCETWNILEIGCGYGLLSIPFLGITKQYSGIDIVEKTVEFGNSIYKELNIPNAKLFVATEVMLDIFDDASFDFIFAENVFIHTPPEITKKYLCQISKKLKSKGKFLVLINMKYKGEGIHGNATESYTILEYEELFKNTGLKILETLDERDYFAENQRGLHIYGELE